MKVPTYNIQQTFNPGTASAPWGGYSSHVNDESRLRNQFFAIQKCEKSEYVPPSTSDLYNYKINSQPVHQPFPKLFEEQQFNKFNPNVCNLGKNLFDNSTRVQLKNLSN